MNVLKEDMVIILPNEAKKKNFQNITYPNKNSFMEIPSIIIKSMSVCQLTTQKIGFLKFTRGKTTRNLIADDRFCQ